MAIAHGVIKQAAYVVDDLDAAIMRWVEVVGAGPFFRIDGARVEDVRYRGRPIDVEVSLALGNSGGLQIELIAPRGEAPSIYRELRRGDTFSVYYNLFSRLSVFENRDGVVYLRPPLSGGLCAALPRGWL